MPHFLSWPLLPALADVVDSKPGEVDLGTAAFFVFRDCIYSTLSERRKKLLSFQVQSGIAQLRRQLLLFPGGDFVFISEKMGSSMKFYGFMLQGSFRRKHLLLLHRSLDHLAMGN